MKVRGVTEHLNNAVLIPQRCVTQLQGINQVMVVKPDNTVEVRNVTTGDTAGSDWIITSGLKAGEKVIVEGIQKVQDGMVVTPQPYVAPASDQSSTNAPAAARRQTTNDAWPPFSSTGPSSRSSSRSSR